MLKTKKKNIIRQNTLPTQFEIFVGYCAASDCDLNLWDPVCDSRNITHKNECLFRVELCKLSHNNTILKKPNETKTYIELPLKIVHYGRCGGIKFVFF